MRNSVLNHINIIKLPKTKMISQNSRMMGFAKNSQVSSISTGVSQQHHRIASKTN